MASNGINQYSWSQYEAHILDILDLDPEEQEQAAAYNRDHDEVVAGKLSHIYQCDLIQPSSHDWISSETVQGKVTIDPETGERIMRIRQEFVEPVVEMADRFDDRDLELLPVERICNYCNQTFSIYAKTCTVCEMADASI